ncbi:hypothetical protein JNW88_06990 [Micromonospora sp. ATA32]|nr:hypothetical protein [Micromonospora sp. ATA32]
MGRLADEHYPHHPGGNLPRPPRPRARTSAEEAFLALGEGAHRWLIEAGATGVARVRAKMAHAVELAAVLGAQRVDEALGLAAIAGRFADGDLASICDHLAAACTWPTWWWPTRTSPCSRAPADGGGWANDHTHPRPCGHDAP